MSMFRPMLAAQIKDAHKLVYPLFASHKLDGIRATIRKGVVYSRSNKPIPNLHVQALFSDYEHLDGELILGDPYDGDVFSRTTMAVMRQDGTPDVTFYVFDHIKYPEMSYIDRLALIYSAPNVIPLPQTYVTSYGDVLDFEGRALERGYEGVILRSPFAPYKFGRSTLRSQHLLKLKRFTDAEAEIVGATEKFHNSNEPYIDDTGYIKRSEMKDGLVGTGVLGSFTCVTKHGLEFKVGTGYTEDERSYYWEYKDDYIGKILKYKYFDVGDYEVPRHPVFLGIRDECDL